MFYLQVTQLNFGKKLASRRGAEKLTLVFIYSGDYAERVIRNLINDPSFCKSCGLLCDSCKYNVYSFMQNIRAAIQMPKPSELPTFIDNPEKYMPKKTPKADLCIASGLHKDLLLELPSFIHEIGISGLIVPVEDFTEMPSGLRRQVEEKCQKLGVEYAFPKPFCSLEPVGDKPLISKFVDEMRVGRPSFEISASVRGKREIIDSVIVRRSSPCGSSWYVAKKLVGTETRKDVLYDNIAKAHHSYPCTATMNTDPEVKEPLLHVGGYIVREEVEKALRKA